MCWPASVLGARSPTGSMKRSSQDAVHDALVVVVLDRAPVVHRSIDQVHDFLYASLFCEVDEEPVLQGLQNEVLAFPETRKLRPSQHHANLQDDALSVPM